MIEFSYNGILAQVGTAQEFQEILLKKTCLKFEEEDLEKDIMFANPKTNLFILSKFTPVQTIFKIKIFDEDLIKEAILN